jgi:ACS family tartrate transporter-like MFS transporter
MDATSDKTAIGKRTLAKVAWRLVPFLALLYVFNIIDRSNVGFARLKMTEDLSLSDDVIDYGYGLFYVGYLLFEVPSNLLLRRFGARAWIARIMVTWGLVSMLTAFVTGPGSYYGARILLGVAEAGFFPGIIYYLTAWFPAAQRARVVAGFMLAIPISTILGNPISGAIMDRFQGTGGLAGWQWLFILEGIPAILLGASVLWYLPDGPGDAAWLAADERDWLEREIVAEVGVRSSVGGHDKLSALADPRVWLLIALYFSVAVGTNATGSYLPKLVKDSFEPIFTSSDGTYWKIGLLTTLPSILSVIAMLVVSRISDRTKARATLVAGALSAAAVGWYFAWQGGDPWTKLAGLCVAQAGMMAVLPVFWALPPLFLGGVAAAAGIALINSVANIGGIIAPRLVGAFGVGPLVAVMLWGVAMALVVWRSLEWPMRMARKNQEHISRG